MWGNFYVFKNVCDRMFSKHFKKCFKMMGMIMLSICKTFSEQTFTKYCQQMLLKCFVCPVYQTFYGKCLENISSITFISSASL